MKIDIIPIGNSKGIRIPKALLEQCGFTECAYVAVENNHLVVRPSIKPRQGWEQSFQAMAAHQDDALLDGYTDSAFDAGEWQW